STARWTSSSTSDATISNDPGIPGFATGIAVQGSVTGLKAGHVTITANAGGTSGAVDTIVTTAPPTLLNISPLNGVIPLGFPQQLAVTMSFADNTLEDVTSFVTWTTSDPTVVVVYPGGLAYPTGRGTATISTTMNGVAGLTTLTVQ